MSRTIFICPLYDINPQIAIIDMINTNNILGEKNLARLLNAGFKVEQGNTRNTIEQLLVDAALQKNPLTKPEQGVVKTESSECGGHAHEHRQGGSCGGHTHEHKHEGKCCGKH